MEGDQIFSDFAAWRAGDVIGANKSVVGVIGTNKSVVGIIWVPS